MTSNRLILFLMFAGIASFSGLSQVTEAQDAEQEKFDKVLETANAEFQNLIRSEYDLEVDFLKRKFNLDDADLLKLRIYAKSVARQQWRSLEDSFKRKLSPWLGRIDGTTFSVNDKRFTFDGEEEEGQPFLTIQIQLHRAEGWGILKVDGSNFGHLGAFQSDDFELQTFRDTEKYRNSLKAFSDQQREDFEQARTNFRKEGLFKSATVLIADRLHLDPEQQAELEAWIRSKMAENDDVIDAYLHDELYSDVGKLITGEIRQLEAPPFLNDVQKRGWRLFKNSPYPLGW